MSTETPRLHLSADELLTTTRSVRRRLDLERPVARIVVEECLRIAFQAPTGSNEQDWGWVLVDDPTTRSAMADIYRQGRRDHAGQTHPKPMPPAKPGLVEGIERLHRHLADVPMLLVPVIGERYGRHSTFQQASRWGSVIPAVWSFMLALRERGLGSVWTTLHLHREQEMAELLGIPHPEYTQVGLFPIAYTIGTSFKPADRRQSEGRIFWNRWPSAE